MTILLSTGRLVYLTLPNVDTWEYVTRQGWSLVLVGLSCLRLLVGSLALPFVPAQSDPYTVDE